MRARAGRGFVVVAVCVRECVAPPCRTQHPGGPPPGALAAPQPRQSLFPPPLPRPSPPPARRGRRQPRRLRLGRCGGGHSPEGRRRFFVCGGDGKLRLGVAGGELVQSVVGEQQTQHGGAELGEVQPEETGRGVTMDLCRCTCGCAIALAYACVLACVRVYIPVCARVCMSACARERPKRVCTLA